MPFNKLAEIKNVAKYKEILKAELGKLSEVRVGYHFFDKVKLEGGSKDGDPFVLVGTYTRTIVEELKAAGGQLKARGAIGEAADKSLEYTVAQGTLKASTLKSALAEVRSFVVAEASDAGDAVGVKEAALAQGQVIDTQGGREGLTTKQALDERRQRLKAELDKLQAVLANKVVAEKLPAALREKMGVALKTGRTALGTADERTITAVLGDITLQMSLFAQAERLKASKADAVVEKAAQDAIAESKRVDDANSAVEAIESSLLDAAQSIATAELDVQNALKSLGAANLKPGQTVKQTPYLTKVQTALATAQKDAAALKLQLVTAKKVLADKPDQFKKLLGRWTGVSGRLEELEVAAQSLFADLGLTAAPSKVGDFAASPGLKAAGDALEKQFPGVADGKKKLVDMLQRHEAEAERLRGVHGTLGGRLRALTDLPLGDGLLKAYETEVLSLKQRFDEGPDPRALALDEGLRQQAAAVDDWLKERGAQIELARAADIGAKVKVHLAAPWGAADPRVRKDKAELDRLLSGDEAVSAALLKPLVGQLRAAGSPPWDKQWLQKQQPILKLLAGKPVPFDDLGGWARRAFLSKRDTMDGKSLDKSVGEVETAVLAELKARMKSLLSEMAAAFGDLNPGTRANVVKQLNAQIDATKDLASAAGSLEDFRRSVAWDFELAMEAQLKAAFNARELQRRPTREQWMKHLGIAKNTYKMVKSNRVFECNGRTHATHFTVSYDSVTATQPRIYEASPASVLNAAFIAGVPTVLQAHATIEFENSDDNPHLYLSGDIFPKGLVGEDVARAKAVLTEVRNELRAWLDDQIQAFQKTIS